MLSAACRLFLKKALARLGMGEELANAVDSATTDPFGPQTGRVVKILEAELLGNLYVTVTTVPVGAILRYVGVKILTPIVAGGTSVKVAAGQQSGTMAAYGKTSAFTAGLHFEALYNAVPLVADTNIDLTIVNAAGDALGNTGVVSGKVIVAVVADTPAVLPTV